MTENKRFTLKGLIEGVPNICDNGEIIEQEDAIDLLNALHEENEQLKQREKTLEGMIRTFDEGCKEIYDDKCRLKEENEQLKQENKKLKEDLEHCANQFTNDGKNVLLSLR